MASRPQPAPIRRRRTNAGDVAQQIEATPHPAPIDAVLAALDEASCAVCVSILRILKGHLEVGIPAWPTGEVR